MKSSITWSTFSCLACWWIYWAFGIVNMGQNFLQLENPSKTCVLPLSSPKGTFNISKDCAAFCPNLKQNFMETHHSLQCAIFGVQQHHKWTNTHLNLTRITQSSALFKAENNLVDMSVYIEWQKFTLTAAGSAGDQPGNYLTALCKLQGCVLPFSSKKDISTDTGCLPSLLLLHVHDSLSPMSGCSDYHTQSIIMQQLSCTYALNSRAA